MLPAAPWPRGAPAGRGTPSRSTRSSGTDGGRWCSSTRQPPKAAECGKTRGNDTRSRGVAGVLRHSDACRHRRLLEQRTDLLQRELDGGLERGAGRVVQQAAPQPSRGWPLVEVVAQVDRRQQQLPVADARFEHERRAAGTGSSRRSAARSGGAPRADRPAAAASIAAPGPTTASRCARRSGSRRAPRAARRSRGPACVRAAS